MEKIVVTHTVVEVKFQNFRDHCWSGKKLLNAGQKSLGVHVEAIWKSNLSTFFILDEMRRSFGVEVETGINRTGRKVERSRSGPSPPLSLSV